MKTKELDFESGKIKETIEEGKKFWKVDIQFLIENSSDGKGVASYNPFFDRIEFHSKHIAKKMEDFPSIIDEEIEFCVLHELGHAKEARIYQDNSLWPYTRGVAVPTTISRDSFFEREIQEIIDTFFNGIWDFKVDKKLFENGFPKPKLIRFHVIFPYIKQILENSNLRFLQVDDMINAFMNMPQTMSSYRFCKKISSEERETIKDYYLKIQGTELEWKRIVGILDTLRFGDIKNTIGVNSKLLEEFFNFQLSLESADKELLEQNIRNELNLQDDFSLPSFWTKKTYQHYLIRPPQR